MRKGIDPKALQGLISDLKEATIDELCNRAIDGGLVDDEYKSKALLAKVAVDVRRAIRQLTDDDGHQLWWNIVQTNEDGEEKNVYVQENLFDVEDYRKTARWYAERASYFASVARGLAKRCKARFGASIQLDFGFKDPPKKPGQQQPPAAN